MKRELTLILKTVDYEYKVSPIKELDGRIGTKVKILGNIIVGESLTLHFEDGYSFKTKGLDINGFINEYERSKDNPYNKRLKQIVLCTKDIYFIFDISDDDFKLDIEEQLSLL